MKNKFDFIKKYKKSFLVGGLAFFVLLYFIFGRGENGTEGYIVKEANIEQSVMLSGKVTTSDKADLGFAAAGRLAKVLVENNQKVKEGMVLAQLEIGNLLADLKIKQANLRQENTTIESAYRVLLSEDLVLVPSSNNYDVEPPVVGGAYDGLEGQYKLRIIQENISSSNFQLLTFGLEKTEKVINEEGQTLLGTKGLYISFPDANISEYNNTSWYLDIPNKSGASYASNLNAYNEAKNSESQAAATESVAQAEIQKIQAEITQNTIYAPFAGIVTNIEKEVGESASIGERVVSILGEEKLEIVLQVSELDVSKLMPNLPIQISIDAIPGEIFNGVLKTVNSRETEIDGVPVYEAFVELQPDSRIKTGMSASGLVVLATKNNVLAVPSYVIIKDGGKNLVEVMLPDGNTKEVEITLGLLGTDNMVEVISGLQLGDKVLSDNIKK